MTPTALVTGSSAGIGGAIARRLLDAGYRVTGLSRTLGGGAELKERYPRSFSWLACDLSDAAATQRAIAEATRGMDALSAVVCAAGSGLFGSVEDTDDTLSLAQFAANYHGVVRTVRATLPMLRQGPHGRIVVIGSLAARAPIPFQAHYSASKAALEAFVLALAGELRGSGISVSLVEPGDINTGFNDVMRWVEPSSFYTKNSAAVEAVVRRSVDEGPSPDHVADGVRRLLSVSRPRLRLTVGPARWLVPVASRLLPDRVNVLLLQRHFDVAPAGASR